MVKYDSYKDSRVEWIGKVPSDWEIKRVGYISKLLTGNPWKSDLFDFDEGIKIVRGENVSEGFLRWGDRTRYWKENVEKDSIFYLKDCDIVISMDGSKVGKNYVHIKEEDLPLLLHQRMCRVRVNESYESKFILYFIGSDMFKYYIDVSKTDPMVPHITQKNIYDFKVSVPPLTEQTQIVQYLDNKTTLIDTLIQKTQEKINLLREKRTSLINHTVTKGLNPDVEMKDSGVEWIGEIPKHWELRLGSSLGNFSKGNGIKKDEVTETGFPCIRYGEIYTTYELKFWDTKSFVNDETSLTSVTVNHGVLLLTGSGETPEDIGKCVVYLGTQPLFVGGDIIILKPKENFNSLFLSYLINSECVRIQREISSKGEIIVHIYSKNFKEMRFPLPPLSEQNRIVEFLDEQTQLIDTLIQKEEKRVELLKEYRQTLISDMVTGKIKVCN